jgi:hypothetical protein
LRTEEADLEPYVIRQGDFLLKVAHKFGFDADTIWNDAKNDALRQVRPNPNILLPGDVLYIPDQANRTPALKPLVTGTTNTFTSHTPTLSLTCKFIGAEAATYASKAFTVQELADLVGLQTDDQGVATFPIPVTLTRATITFIETGECVELGIAAMDPINSLEGIFKRLQNLGHIPREVDGVPVESSGDLKMMRRGLRYFKASQSSGDDAAGGSTPSESPSDPTGDGRSASTGQGDSGWDAAGGSEEGAPFGGDPGPANSPPDPSDDDAGLADNGTLDGDLAALLLKVYGC